ncbi:MAG: ABC transporter permease [Syntrophus sp. (in: bacteria)]|nr:ABC transporter permease [Syntrophus sp. (in: bacteria)]
MDSKLKRKLQYYFDLILVLTQKELKVRYKNSVLGYLWSVAHPLAFALVFFIAFKVVVKIQIEDYALFLIAGLFPWQWFANSVNASPMILLGNASIIKKVGFPRYFIILTQVIQDMIHFLLAIPVIILFLFLYHKTPYLSWLYGIPVLLTAQFFIIYGICLIVASTNLFFRDLERLTILSTMLLFYFTPVFFDEAMIPRQYQNFLYLNPLSLLIVNWRMLFLSGKINALYLLGSYSYAGFIFLIGYMVYRKLSWKFAEVL